MQIRKGLRLSYVRDQVFSQLLQSRTRLKILSLLSRRPRTLRELSHFTGISVQGVLRHLDSLKELGFIEERKIRTKRLPVRRLYALTGVHVDDFSSGDLAVVWAAPPVKHLVKSKITFDDLETTAGELLIQRRVIKQRARRLARMIGALSDEESDLVRGIEALGLDEEEQLVLGTVLTEDTTEDAVELLSGQGLKNSKELIEKVLRRVRSAAKK
jgi:predicted transcriptional regulator